MNWTLLGTGIVSMLVAVMLAGNISKHQRNKQAGVKVEINSTSILLSSATSTMQMNRITSGTQGQENPGVSILQQSGLVIIHAAELNVIVYPDDRFVVTDSDGNEQSGNINDSLVAIQGNIEITAKKGSLTVEQK